jgi:hypothetical protein
MHFACQPYPGDNEAISITSGVADAAVKRSSVDNAAPEVLHGCRTSSPAPPAIVDALSEVYGSPQ